MDPGGPQEPLRGPQVKTIFMIPTHHLPFSLCCHLHRWAKAMVLQRAGASAQILAVAPTTTAVCCSHHTHSGKKKPILFRNVLMNCQTHWFSWTLTLYYEYLQYSLWKMGTIHEAHPHPSTVTVPRKSTHTVVCVTSSTSHFFMQCHFYLKEQLTNYGCSDFGIWQKFS